MKINSVRVDSTNSITDLCRLGVKYPTDKSPYNKEGGLHKHAYTSIYDMLFSHIRYNNFVLGEIGILDNNSMLCWREYFPNAVLYGFEYSEEKLKKGIADNLKNAHYHFMDVTKKDSIAMQLSVVKYYDILIEDSTHVFDDQIRFVNEAVRHLKAGGFLIVEDIFIDADESKYEKKLEHLSQYFSSATFIFADHELKHSPNWNNDKLLVLVRNDKKIENS
ncbi:MAG: class I SAM-dependent methyltransferase [Flavobacterium sp.]